MKKNGFLSTAAIAGMLSLIVSAAIAYTPVKQDDKGVAVYDYSNFGAVGTFTSVTDPANSKVTHIYSNMKITGHYGSGQVGGTIGTNSGAWNVEEVTWFNANGTVAKTFDVVNNITDYYSVNGKLTKREVVLEGPGVSKQTCTSYPQYNTDGSYTLETKGLFKDPTKAEGEGSSYVGVRSKVFVDANGRTQWEENYSLDEKGNKTTSRSTYEYDAAGNLKYRETKDEKGRVTGKLYYKFGRPDHAENTDYNPSGTGNSSETQGNTQTSVKYNYSGNRLLNTQSYDKTGKLVETSAFDAFGRVSRVSDAMGRVTGEYQYNDSGHDVSVSLGNYSVTVKPGGCSLFISTTYDGNSGAKKVDHTIYINGNTNTPMCTKTISDTTSSGDTTNTNTANTNTGNTNAGNTNAGNTNTGNTNTGNTNTGNTNTGNTNAGNTNTGNTNTGNTNTGNTNVSGKLTPAQIAALQKQEDEQTAKLNTIRKNLNKLAGDVDKARKAKAKNLSSVITSRDTAQKEYNRELNILLGLRKQITDAGASFK